MPNCREGRQNLIGSVDREHIVRASRVAEECGYYALWPNDIPLTWPEVGARYVDPPNLFDCLVTMTYAMAVTERIRVTPSTVVLPLYDPFLFGRQIASLDVLSGGRVTLGIGLGGNSKEEFGRMRAGNPDRSKLMDEQMQALRVLWSDRRATYQGKYVKFADLETHPKPVQKPLPVLRAGHAESAFEGIARYCQGWIDSNHSPEEIVTTAAHIRELFDTQGRSGEPFEIARQFYVSIAPTDEEAKANVAAAVPPATRPQAPRPAPAEGAPKPAAAPARPASTGDRQLVGTPQKIRDRLKDYAATGVVTEICAIFISPNIASAERQMKLFASDVAPYLA